jgi:predicted DNA-binding transcriptional regulator YafY
MTKPERMFDLIQRLRRAKKPVIADRLAAEMEVNVRTIYRDIATLQAMRVPIEGEAGVGYVMRKGYDLPPLMFTTEEVEAITVGLALLRRTGDRGLIRASTGVLHKISAILPEETGGPDELSLLVSDFGVADITNIDVDVLRATIRDQTKIHIIYFDGNNTSSRRKVLPLGLYYYVEVVTLLAWCELRQDFRNFRLDRIANLDVLKDSFKPHGARLRLLWRERQNAHAH